MKPSAARILEHLRQNRHRAVPAVELCNLGALDYRKRVSEIRKLGYIITTESIKGKPYSAYRLVMEVQG